MHIGGALILDGPPPSAAAVRAQVASRLHLIPRYRQRLAVPRFEAGRPFWVDDPTFNIEYHVRDSALPPPGTVTQLERLTARIFSQRLDRAKPLWELWFITGLEDNRFALITKTHHSLVDGVSGVDIGTVMLDADTKPINPAGPAPDWEPHPEPSQKDLIFAGVRDLAEFPLTVAEQAVRALEDPGRAIAGIRERLTGIGQLALETLDPAPPTPLNVKIGSHRRYAWVGTSLNDFKEIKRALGGTVNDVVLTVVADAVGRWMRSRGEPTDSLDLRALVPVSTRGSEHRGSLGNQITAMRAPLPVASIDPVERLDQIRAAMEGLKESKQALGAEVIADVQNFAPPTLLAQASRLNFSTRIFNLLVTNVPGPQIPLYLLGRKVLHVLPVAFLPERQALAVAAVSYHGELSFGLLGDYDAMPDLDVIAHGIRSSIADLSDIASTTRTQSRARSQVVSTRKRPTSRRRSSSAPRKPKG